MLYAAIWWEKNYKFENIKTNLPKIIMIKKSLNPWLNTFHLNLTYLLSDLFGGITDEPILKKLVKC